MNRVWPSDKTAFIFIAALSVALFFFRLGDRSLRNPDEGRYAEIAREMVVSGHWAEPTLYGIDYLKKPVLFYWLVALSFKIFGFSEWAARLVPALFGVFGVLVTFFFSRKVFDAGTAWPAALVLATNFWYVQVGRYLVTDMVFSFFLVLALYSFYLGLAATRFQTAWYLLFYAGLALAFLTKGPAAVAVAALGILVYFLSAGRLGAALSRIRLVRGGLLFSAIVLPWFVWIERKNPGFLRNFILHEHLNRFVSSRFEHQEPWFYYLAAVPLFFLPWTLFWKPLRAAFSGWWREGPPDARRFLGSCALATVVFYSLSRSKMPTYILPAIPLLSVLVGCGWRERLPAARKIFYGIVGMLAAALFVSPFAMEKVNLHYTTRHFAEALKGRLSAGDPVFIYDHPGPFYDFAFYLGRPVKLVGLAGEFEGMPEDARTAEHSISRERFERLIREKSRFYCLMRRSDFDGLSPDLQQDLKVILQDKRKVLLESAPLPAAGVQ